MYIHRPHAVFCTLFDLLNFDLSQVEQIVKLEILEQVLWDPWGEAYWIDGHDEKEAIDLRYLPFF